MSSTVLLPWFALPNVYVEHVSSNVTHAEEIVAAMASWSAPPANSTQQYQQLHRTLFAARRNAMRVQLAIVCERIAALRPHHVVHTASAHEDDMRRLAIASANVLRDVNQDDVNVPMAIKRMRMCETHIGAAYQSMHWDAILDYIRPTLTPGAQTPSMCAELQRRHVRDGSSYNNNNKNNNYVPAVAIVTESYGMGSPAYNYAAASTHHTYPSGMPPRMYA